MPLILPACSRENKTQSKCLGPAVAVETLILQAWMSPF
jgi:hypothetical protein